ncbi:MAG: hypothetical protein HY815_18440 [Candidatus Riflebacteria bacterium]|nr:hypothetical protein [Candidatus Riflebacteria bacterium]
MRVVLLGPQRLQPMVAQTVGALNLHGPVATVTAGWQEYEDEDLPLQNHLGGNTINLRLHRRGEEVFRTDPELAAAYRARQERLRQYQGFYRVRLEYALEAAQAISRRQAARDVHEEEWQASIDAVRSLDQMHLARCRQVHADFEERWHPWDRDSIAKHRVELARQVGECTALVIAGGHVAVLLNRLKLFGIGEMVGARPVIAWSAGAMAISERVVLFHDRPPQGPGIAEVLDAGMALCPGVVPLPDPSLRLSLDDRERVSTYARRFAPAACLVMGHGARIVHDGAGWSDPSSIQKMGADGDLEALDASAIMQW